jgi:hypothetical protein
VDGRLTLAPDVLLLFGDERWQAVAGSAEDVYKRLIATHQPGATLEGSGSFATSDSVPDPLPPADGDLRLLYEDFLPEAIVHRPGHRGWFTAVDSHGRIRWQYKDGAAWPGGEWEGWYALVLVAHCTPPEYLAYLRRESIPYLVAGQERVDLRAALEKMGALLGVTCILSTAGGRLNGALLRAGLVDEISIEFFPAIIGGTTTPSLFDSPELKPGEWPTRLTLITAQVQDGGRVWLHYQVSPHQELTARPTG